MATKRRRMDMLTGGTGDVNPDALTFALTQSAANVYTELEVPLPTRGLNPLATQNRNAVYELLWVDLQVPVDGLVDADEYKWQLCSTSQSAATTLGTVSCFIADKYELAIVTSGSFHMENYRRYNFTSGDGHGILIATDAIFVGADGTSLANALVLRGKIYGRIKWVGLQEYMGLTLRQRTTS